MSKRHTSDDYHTLAASRGYVWVGEELPKDNKTKTIWRCASGHTFLTSYNKVSSGHGCAICAGNVALTQQSYVELATSRGFIWLGGEIPDGGSHGKTTWQCAENHQWKTTYNAISRGRGCPYCTRRAPITSDDYSVLASKRGFTWIGELPKTTFFKTRWRCAYGHEWDARYNDIYNGQGCPECKRTTIGNLKRSTPDRYKQISAPLKIEWVGDLPTNQSHKTEWRCANGHVWSSTYASMRLVKGCPICQDRINGQPVSRVQRRLHEMIGGELNYPIKRYRIDVAFTDDKIAVEYDGWRYHDPAHDAKRDKYLRSIGWKVLRIRSGELLPAFEEIKEALSRLRAGESHIVITLADWRD